MAIIKFMWCEIIKQIFNNLNFKIDAVVNKTRKVYKKDETEFDIDYIENLGYFLEIEANTKENLLKYIQLNPQELTKIFLITHP